MNPQDRERISTAVRTAFAKADMPWPPTDGPVPLDRLIERANLDHEELTDLTRAKAAAELVRYNIACPGIERDQTPLAGFIVVDASAAAGVVFVSRGDNLPRRRFSAAHELGHFLLHFDPQAAADEPFRMDDSLDTIERGEEDDDQEDLAQREREANRFAAELLMPEPVVRRLCEQYRGAGRSTVPYLTGHIASDLLVSREAARWRLRELGLVRSEWPE